MLRVDSVEIGSVAGIIMDPNPSWICLGKDEPACFIEVARIDPKVLDGRIGGNLGFAVGLLGEEPEKNPEGAWKEEVERN
jgi:hypothetical protein